MQPGAKSKNIYKEIQKKLFYMIPEKWDKVYLYASVIEGMNQLETGEMFFYYFPKGILKKEPVNVYEVPNKFNIEEREYFKLADELYGWLKELRKAIFEENGKRWSNVTISIENFKFIVEYHYEDLNNSPYNSYERHIIWRYRYLKTSLNTYNKKERNIILDYLNRIQIEEVDTYTEGIYQNQMHHTIAYDKKEENREEIIPAEIKSREEEQKNQILNYHKN